MPLNEQVINWSLKEYSHLPWRQNRSLYNTLVSEIMLQQTTVGTVLNHFERFIKKFPDVATLASITEEEILVEWKGLGYYRRAKNLLKAAKDIQDKFDGKIPQDFERLKSISGVGDYTASAILAMGANLNFLAVDANLERVLARLYGIKEEKGLKLQRKIRESFGAGLICQDIKKFGGRDYNEALMDLGRMVCKARSASCEICPLSGECKSIGKDPLSIPVEAPNKKEKTNQLEVSLLRVIVKKEENLLAYQKSQDEWLSGQYEIPTFLLASNDPKFKQYELIKNQEELFLLPSLKTSITKYKINNYILHANLTDLKKLNVAQDRFEWISNLDLLSTASTKSLNLK